MVDPHEVYNEIQLDWEEFIERNRSILKEVTLQQAFCWWIIYNTHQFVLVDKKYVANGILLITENTNTVKFDNAVEVQEAIQYLLDQNIISIEDNGEGAQEYFAQEIG